jgi:hypothetical protein
MASRFVQYGSSFSPGIGGMTGTVPVAMTIPWLASISSSPTRTRPSPETTPSPRTNRPPLETKRSTAALSSQLSVAWRTRPATGAQSGRTEAVPAIWSTRRPSANRLPARIIIFDGMQPQ